MPSKRFGVESARRDLASAINRLLEAKEREVLARCEVEDAARQIIGAVEDAIDALTQSDDAAEDEQIETLSIMRG